MKQFLINYLWENEADFNTWVEEYKFYLYGILFFLPIALLSFFM